MSEGILQHVNSGKRSLVLNLFAGPGSGKSTIMAAVFSELKWLGVNAEMAPEFAKEKVWEKSFAVLGNQIYVFGKQLHSIVRVHGQVDVVVTDSPLLLSLIYGEGQVKEFRPLVLAVHNQFDTLNLFLRRKKKYNPSGRMQSELEAKEKDDQIERMLVDNEIPFNYIDADRDAVAAIVGKVLMELVNRGIVVNQPIVEEKTTVKLPSLPKTFGEAVESAENLLSESDKKALVKMFNEQGGVLDFHSTLGMKIRNEFGMWEGNKELMEDCSRFIGDEYSIEGLHPDEASYAVLNALAQNLVDRKDKGASDVDGENKDHA